MRSPRRAPHSTGGSSGVRPAVVASVRLARRLQLPVILGRLYPRLCRHPCLHLDHLCGLRPLCYPSLHRWLRPQLCLELHLWLRLLHHLWFHHWLRPWLHVRLRPLPRPWLRPYLLRSLRRCGLPWLPLPPAEPALLGAPAVLLLVEDEPLLSQLVGRDARPAAKAGRPCSTLAAAGR